MLHQRPPSLEEILRNAQRRYGRVDKVVPLPPLLIFFLVLHVIWRLRWAALAACVLWLMIRAAHCEESPQSTMIMIVCLRDDPNICREEKTLVDGISCVMQGQEVAAQWLDEHPKWWIKGLRCKVGGGRDA